MNRPVTHVCLLKALLSLWVIGMCIPHVAWMVMTFVRHFIRNLGPSDGTGGVFASVRVGLSEAMGTEALRNEHAVMATVVLVGAIVFMRSPVPKLLRPLFQEKRI
jgi:hypothetical protein